MKKNFYSLIPACLIMLMMALTMNARAYSSGAPSGYTGSPGDGHTCTSCHGGSATVVTGFLTTDIPSSGYVPGTTYTITVSFTGSGGKGFEVSPQNPSGTLLGTLIPGTGSKLVGGGKYCTHNPKQSSGTATWVFTWTAPSAGTGDVTFYGAFAITENTTRKEAVTVTENAPLAVVVSATPSNICIGGSTQLNATVTGGSGNYTYNWSSIPAGFTSTIQNPVASPVVNTTYIVEAGDGTNTIIDSADVTVQAAPTAFAGNDTIVCTKVTQIILHGNAGNSSSTLWTTAGDGTFNDASLLQAVYYPGANDKTSLHVNLTLTANGISPCSAASSVRHITFDPCSGMEDLNNDDLSFSFWPNPTTGKLTLSVKRLSAAAVMVSISDLTGISRYRETFDSPELSLTRSMDLGSLSAGIYLFRIESGNTIRVQKLVIL